ncbi:hypothetical protein ABXS75_09270 [Roseburia hominis]
MDQQTTLFSNKNLKAMIVPLFLEQLLVMRQMALHKASGRWPPWRELLWGLCS